MALTQQEYIAAINQYVNDSVKNKGIFRNLNEENFRFYNGDPLGNEKKNQSQVVSRDCFDVVESDMPSMIRTFLGSDDVLIFQPNNPTDPEDIREAEEKTAYAHWLMRNQKNSFKIIHDWIKDAEIQKFGAVKYFMDEQEDVQPEKWQSIDIDEADAVKLSFTDRDDVKSIEEEENEDGTINLEIKLSRKVKTIKIVGIPTENFLISRNAESLDEAILVGDETFTAKGELVAMGIPEEKVKELVPAVDPEGTTMRDLRFRDQGGSNKQGDTNLQRGQQLSSPPEADWCTEQVLVQNLYIKIDKDGDGICERRYVMKVGQEILEDELFDHVPYAMMSAIAMPHNAIGRSRVDIAKETQREKSIVKRGMYNNIAKVNNPRMVVNTNHKIGKVNIDDLLTNNQFGMIRVDGAPTNVQMLETPYIGDKALQVIQYIDLARAQSTGSLMASQGLNADSLSKETATRFEGVQDEGGAKTELVMRVYAETGFRKLFEGLIWTAQRFQDSEQEVLVLGKQLTFNPSSWKREHYALSNVGLGAGDSKEMAANAGAILQTLISMREQGISVADDVKIYNAFKKVLKALGAKDVQSFANNPEVPLDQVQLQIQQLSLQNEQLQLALEQAQQTNPLAEAELIKQQGNLELGQQKAEIEALKVANSNQQFFAKLEQSQQQFLLKLQQDQEKILQDQQQFNQEMIARMTELELEHDQNIPGSNV